MTSELYKFLNENDFVKTGHHSTSTGFGFTETNEFSKDNVKIYVCECDEEKTVIRIEMKGTLILPNTNLNKFSIEHIKDFLMKRENKNE